MWYLYFDDTPGYWGSITEEGGERITRKGEEFYEMLSSGHDKAVTLMNLQKLWLPAEDLQEIKPVNIPEWVTVGHMWLHS